VADVIDYETEDFLVPKLRSGTRKKSQPHLQGYSLLTENRKNKNGLGSDDKECYQRQNYIRPTPTNRSLFNEEKAFKKPITARSGFRHRSKTCYKLRAAAASQPTRFRAAAKENG
jgi:hypothetical protein